MTPLAAVIVLAAALVHALWNLLLSKSDDDHSRTAAVILIGAVALLPLALADFRVEPAAWPFIAVSAVFELAYFALLSTAYARAPAGVVYPLARGSAPVFVLIVSVVFLGGRFDLLSVAGMIMITIGIVIVRGLSGRIGADALLLAPAIGACIAGYTLVDSVGLRHAAPAAYLEIVLLITGICYAAVALRMRGWPALRSTLGWRAALTGVGMAASYVLVLIALTMAPAAPVAALRETSVVLLMIMLAVTGRERVTVARVLGAVLVTVGVACVVS